MVTLRIITVPEKLSIEVAETIYEVIIDHPAYKSFDLRLPSSFTHFMFVSSYSSAPKGSLDTSWGICEDEVIT